MVTARRKIELGMLPQPDDFTCGPTCLHAVYRYYGDDRPLDEVVQEIAPLDTGGTLAVTLACHALRNGYEATIFSYNLTLFDPTWFDDGVDLAAKLKAQAAAKPDDAKLGTATAHYLELLSLGGRVVHEELTADLLRRHLERGRPILTGLSATYLYDCARERGNDYDDVGGEPTGHFVVLCGMEDQGRRVLVADPLHDNPRFRTSSYSVDLNRLISAILLGIVTYDANLLVIAPRSEGAPTGARS